MKRVNTREMTENEKPKPELAVTENQEQNFPFGPDIELVDASVLVQESGLSHEDQNGPFPHPADDKTLGFPSEDPLSGNQVLPCESKDKATDDIKMLDAGLSEHSSDTHVQNHVEAATSVVLGEALTSNTKDENLQKKKNRWTDIEMAEANESGAEEERVAFMNELESFHKENALEYKPPKFYGEPLNCLKLWRSVIRLGGYELVTATKLWRQVGESFHPPKTCTTVSWTFRIFYEKALLEYEKHKIKSGELQLPVPPILSSANVEREGGGYQTPASGRVRRDSAARAMQGWHSQRNVFSEDKTLYPTAKKHIKSIGVQKHKTLTNLEHADKSAYTEADKQLDATVVDIGPPADWVKINVRENNDCYEVYALVPGLLREEVRVQSDPAGRLVITGHPEHRNNPWGITPFKKVVNLPARIDPLQTTAVVSLHGRLSVRVPFEQGST